MTCKEGKRGGEGRGEEGEERGREGEGRRGEGRGGGGRGREGREGISHCTPLPIHPSLHSPVSQLSLMFPQFLDHFFGFPELLVHAVQFFLKQLQASAITTHLRCMLWGKGRGGGSVPIHNQHGMQCICNPTHPSPGLSPPPDPISRLQSTPSPDPIPVPFVDLPFLPSYY